MKFHIAIPTQDLESSKAFYEHLGFQLVREFERPEFGLRLAQLEYGNQYMLELIYHPSNQPVTYSKFPEAMHMGIAVNNLETMLNELEQRGVRILRGITPGVSVKRLAFIADPNGFPVELIEEN